MLTALFLTLSLAAADRAAEPYFADVYDCRKAAERFVHCRGYNARECVMGFCGESWTTVTVRRDRHGRIRVYDPLKGFLR